MVVCQQEVDTLPVGSLTKLAFGDSFYNSPKPHGVTQLVARLNSLHCVEDSFAPLKAPLDASAVCSDRGPQILISIDAATECLVGARVPPSSDQIQGPANDAHDDKSRIAKADVALRLPLQFAAARTIGREFVQDRNVVALILPELEVVPTALRPDAESLLPVRSDGVWMLECDTANELENLADALQRAGCAMQGFEERYELGEMLGFGSFSKVFWAEDRRTGKPVAAKIVPKGGVVKDKLLMKEVCVLRQATHPTVLEFKGFFEAVDPEDQVGVWVIVTEFVGGGELFERVRQNGRFEEHRAAHIIYQLCSALKCLHERRIVHRDIKTENVILVENSEDEIKLVDFGLATPEWDRDAMSVRCGSPGYIAPEVLRNEKYDCKVDCFSVGVLLHILLVGRGPFRGKSTEEMLARNLKGKVSHRPLSHITPEAKDLLLRLLDTDPEQRPTAAEAIEHPWIQQHKRKPRSAVQDGRVDSKVSTAAEDDFVPRISVKASENSLQSLCVERGNTVLEGPLFSNDSVKPLQVHRDQSMSMYFTKEVDGDTPGQNETTQDDNDDDQEAEACANMPLLRTQTPVWADIQRTLSNMRLRGLTPRQTLESYRKSRNSWGDGRISGRYTGRLTRDLFDMERTSTFFTKEADDNPKSHSNELGSPGVLRELAKSDVGKNSASSSQDVPSNTPSQQDVLMELQTETGVAENSKCTVVRRRGASDSYASGNGSSAVRSLRPTKSIESSNMDLMSESSTEIMKPSQSTSENRFCRIRSLKPGRSIKSPDPEFSAVEHESAQSSPSRPDAKRQIKPHAPTTPPDGQAPKGRFKTARGLNDSQRDLPKDSNATDGLESRPSWGEIDPIDLQNTGLSSGETIDKRNGKREADASQEKKEECKEASAEPKARSSEE